MKIRKLLIVPVAGAVLSASLVAGATYALFTSNDKTDISITSSKVSISANIKNLKLYSGQWNESISGYEYVDVTANNKFSNGGTATLSDGSLVLDKISPLDKATFDIGIENLSDILAQYRVTTSLEGDLSFFSALDVNIDGEKYYGFTNSTSWEEMEVGFTKDIHVEVVLPEEAGNDVQGKSMKIHFGAEAIQGNAHTEDAPEGKVALYNATDLRLFSDYVNKGEMNSKTAILMNDIDLEGIEWTQMNGAGKSITFDGNGKTISNLKISDGHNAGFFATASSCTVQNVTFDSAEVDGVGRVGVVVGHGMCANVENVTVKNSRVAAHVTNNDDGDKAGAVVGYLSGEPIAKVIGCTVQNVSVEGYRDIGALVGYAGKTYTVTGNTVKDCTVINNQLINYNNYTTDAQYDVNELIGEQGTAGTISENNVTDTTVVRGNLINTASDLVCFQEKVNSGTNYRNKTVTLGADIDLEGIEWSPIGGGGHRFEGTFDGANHTISNLTSVLDSSTGAKYGNGFFGDITGGATLKNFTLKNANVYDEVDGKGNVYGIVCGYAYGSVTFDNITVESSRVSAFGKVGAILAMAADGAGTTTIRNCTVKDVTLVGTYNVAPFVGLLQNEISFSNNTKSGINWEYSSRYGADTYIDVNNGVIEGITQAYNGIAWNYPDDMSYVFAGYAELYNVMTGYENKIMTFGGQTYIIDALPVNE